MDDWIDPTRYYVVDRSGILFNSLFYKEKYSIFFFVICTSSTSASKGKPLEFCY